MKRVITPCEFDGRLSVMKVPRGLLFSQTFTGYGTGAASSLLLVECPPEEADEFISLNTAEEQK